jgi:hypothetical protein
VDYTTHHRTAKTSFGSTHTSMHTIHGIEFGRLGRDKSILSISMEFNEPSSILELLNGRFFHMQATLFAGEILAKGYMHLEPQEV